MCMYGVVKIRDRVPADGRGRVEFRIWNPGKTIGTHWTSGYWSRLKSMGGP